MLEAAVVGAYALEYFADLEAESPEEAAAFALEVLRSAVSGRPYDFEAAGVVGGKRISRICNRERDAMEEARAEKEADISAKRAEAGRASGRSRRRKSLEMKEKEQNEQIEQNEQNEQTEQNEQNEHIERRVEVEEDISRSETEPRAHGGCELARLLSNPPAPITAAEAEAAAVRRGIPARTVEAWAAYMAEAGWRDRWGTPFTRDRARASLVAWHNRESEFRPRVAVGGGGGASVAVGGGAAAATAGGVYVGGVGTRGGGAAFKLAAI